MYMSPIEDIVHSYGLSCMMYADDSQFYVTLDVSQPLADVEILMSCANSVLEWIQANKLKCNPDKSEAIHFMSRHITAQQVATFSVGGENIDVSAVQIGVKAWELQE
ncbi:hypothetical protein AC249_AIPGENE7593 [Exaiptasia diaphana]|nr:hypothetical protein AC249_AIPGENE7593 [Exaiptasia diaphana]